jgi:hypothetical protein
VLHDKPVDNHGTGPDLFVKTDSGGKDRRTLVSFNLPGLNGCTVTAATLRLDAYASTGTRTIEAWRLAAAWTETGVTWNNQPATAGSAATSTSGIGWRTWDVTSIVQSMYTVANDGFLLKDQTEGQSSIQQTFNSLETSLRPELVVTYG